MSDLKIMMLLKKKSSFPCKYKWKCCFCVVCKFLYFLQTKEDVLSALSRPTRCVLYFNLRSSLPVRSSWSSTVFTPAATPESCHLPVISIQLYTEASSALDSGLSSHYICLKKPPPQLSTNKTNGREGGRSWLSAHLLNMLIDFREKGPCVQRRKTESNQCCQFRI